MLIYIQEEEYQELMRCKRELDILKSVLVDIVLMAKELELSDKKQNVLQT